MSHTKLGEKGSFLWEKKEEKKGFEEGGQSKCIREGSQLGQLLSKCMPTWRLMRCGRANLEKKNFWMNWCLLKEKSSWEMVN